MFVYNWIQTIYKAIDLVILNYFQLIKDKR